MADGEAWLIRGDWRDRVTGYGYARNGRDCEVRCRVGELSDPVTGRLRGDLSGVDLAIVASGREVFRGRLTHWSMQANVVTLHARTCDQA